MLSVKLPIYTDQKKCPGYYVWLLNKPIYRNSLSKSSALSLRLRTDLAFPNYDEGKKIIKP